MLSENKNRNLAGLVATHLPVTIAASEKYVVRAASLVQPVSGIRKAMIAIILCHNHHGGKLVLHYLVIVT